MKKQSSSRLSSLAAQLLHEMKGAFRWQRRVIDVADLRALCASVLSQDETKGQRPAKKKKAKKK